MASGWWDLFRGDGFEPLAECCLSAPSLISLYAIAGLLLALAFFAIAIALLRFVGDRPELQFPSIFRMFALFMFACGLMHLTSIATLWYPVFWLDGAVRAIAAVASVVIAAVLLPLLPKGMRLTNDKQLREIIDRLVSEVAVREKAELELAQLNETLEARVTERTGALQFSNMRLQQEIETRMETESALYEEKERAMVTLRSIADGAITTDVSGYITSLNPVAERMTGWPEDEAIGKTVEDVFHVVHEHNQQPVQNPIHRVLETGEVSGIANYSLLIDRSGHDYPIEDSAAPILDAMGTLLGAVLVFRDVSDARKMASRMSYLAQHDFLTDLPNRVLLTDRLGQAIAHAQRNTAHAALMFLDVDDFKTINDTLGHDIGDRLLQEIARRLLSCVRSSDTVSRQGGDEFVILLPEVQNRFAPGDIAEKLFQAVSKPCFFDQHQLTISLSVGIAVYPEDGVTPEALMKSADAAMYQAKKAGKSNYQFYTRAVNARQSERATPEMGLRRALPRGEFLLHYQPKIDLKTGLIVGSEALLRWNHAELGLLEPIQFMAVAEEAGLTGQLGNWVVQEVCRQNLAWQRTDIAPLPIAVNLSVSQLRSRQFLSDMTHLLGGCGLDPHLLEFEVTESIAMLGRDDAIAWLRSLKAMGVGLSVDNFGTGYSSLSYLKRLPINRIQIDQSFIRDIATDPDDAAIIEAIISMSHSMKLQVIAEGIETIEQLDFVTRHGCDLGQGYLFSRPLPAEEYGKMLAENRNFVESAKARRL